MKPHRLFAACLLAAAPLPAGAWGGASKGASAGGFLELGVSARAAAMGEAYGAVADDASALYWNPAALTNISRRSATFMHAAYLNSSRFEYAAYGQNLGRQGAVGVGFQHFSLGRKMTETDAAGTELGTFSPSDMAVSLGYARRWRGLSLGLAAKFVQSRILATAQTGAADIAALSPPYLNDRLRLAFTATNIGGALKFEGVREPLPAALRLAGSYEISPRWLTALDIVSPRNDDPSAAIGTEYRLMEDDRWMFAGRAGFNSATIGDIDGVTGVSLGIGIGIGDSRIDYGFLPMGGLGHAHRFSLTCDF